MFEDNYIELNVKSVQETECWTRGNCYCAIPVLCSLFCHCIKVVTKDPARKPLN